MSIEPASFLSGSEGCHETPAIANPPSYAHLARTMIPKSPLDDPDKAAFAWARYKRLLRNMVPVTLVVVVLVLLLLYAITGVTSVHFYIASALGVGATIMMGAALMGLTFLSSGTGHDESVTDLADDGEWRD
jgi:hypothetical protein